MEEIGEVVLRKVRADGLVMSRVPKPTRDAFIELSEVEFAGDYGMTLKYIFDNFLLWRVFFENMDMKLDVILNKLENKGTQPIVKKMLDGREIKLKGGSNEQN